MDPSENKRIYINPIDTFVGHNLANFLYKCVIGSTMDEEEEEEEVPEEQEGFFKKKNYDNCYEVHGSFKDKSSIKPSFVKSILKYDTRDEFFEHVVEFDVIIYDISNDVDQIEEALWLINRIHDSFSWLNKEVIFILLSNVLTWSKTKPADPEDTEGTITEEDIKRRKPHPNFKDQFNAEKEVMKLSKKHKSKIKTYVVNCGILYGAGEFVFHDMFKQAWNNVESLTIFGNGNNVIPTIHVNDLAGIIQNIADSKPDNKYIIAVDDSKNTLEDIVKAISSTLSNGKTKVISKEQALVDNLITPYDLEILLMDLRIEPTPIKDEMKIKWVSEAGIVENIEALVNEYKTKRNLMPIKVCVLGPPGSGKTYYCEKLSKEYNLKHLQLKEVITQYMLGLDEAIDYPDKLADEIEQEKQRMQTENPDDPIDDSYRADEVEEAGNKATTAKETKERFINNMNENNGKLLDEDLAIIYKETLLLKEYLSHGFVLDGFPKTKEQANLLFVVDAEDEEEPNPKAPKYNPVVTPQTIFALEASDVMLVDRQSYLALNNNSVQQDQLDIQQAEFKRRLANYRAVNDELADKDEDTVLTYFDLRELHPVVLKLKQDFTKDSEEVRRETLNRMYYELGKPHIYPPSEEELVLIKAKEQDEIKRQEEFQRLNQRIKDQELLTIRKHNQNEWNENLELVRKEMYENSETQAQPLRNYLMHLVMPVLTEGLVECSKVRTEDPIDYLSEFILKSSMISTEELVQSPTNHN